MPQIDVPFLPGDKVRVKAFGVETVVDWVKFGSDGPWFYCGARARWLTADELEAVPPVIRWERDDVYKCWRGGPWAAFETGRLWWKRSLVDTFRDPCAVAEETQALWNERAKGVEG